MLVLSLSFLPLPLFAQAAMPAASVVYRVEAHRVGEPIRLDGSLDEAAWQQAPPLSGFTQNEPDYGKPATFDTEVRLLYDDTHLYVGAVLHDALGRQGVRVPALQRDFNYDASDVFSLILDPFGDERNAFVFQLNPHGAQRDLQVREGIIFNTDWNAVWSGRATINEDGWVVEMAIPWASLRYPAGHSGEARVWRVNFMRGLRRLGEVSGWRPWPRSYSPYHMQYAGELHGLQPPPPRTNVQVQPYVLAREDRTGGRSAYAGWDRAKIGGDVKWAVSPSTVLDLTLNTDFAQADADQQVVNLNRYSVFFPEKRGFFLESAGIFEVGYSLFTPFYSRRIGLEGGQPIPLDVGLRLTSSTPSGQAGALLVRQRGTDLTPATYFGVGRLSRNVGAGGARLGGLLVARHEAGEGDAAPYTNVVATLDGYARLSRTARVTAFASGSTTQGARGDGFATYLWVRQNADWGYVGFLQDIASKEYTAATGFVFRRDIMLNSPAANFDWRPAWKPDAVRNFNPGLSAYVYHRLSDREFLQADLRLEPISVVFKNSAEISLSAGPTWQHLEAEEAASFRPLGVPIAPGRYRYLRARLDANTDVSAPIYASASAVTGGFYDGTLTTLSASVLMRASSRATFGGRYELNAARSLGPAGTDVDSHLFGAEARLALNPRVQAVAFYQYNTLADLAAWNVRFSYEIRPLSFLHLVFNDARYYVPTADRMANHGLYDPQQQFLFKLSYLQQL